MRMTIAIMAMFLCSCSSVVDIKESDVQVVASNYPLSYFAERIGGDSSIVVFPRINGDPAFWEPATDDIINMQKSGMILLNGASYEKWLPSVSLPKGKSVDTSKAFRQAYIRMEKVADHVHGPTGAHSHAGIAFTTWIDLNQAAFQAKAVKDALAKLTITSREVLDKNFNLLIEDLKGLDTEINSMTRGQPEVLLVASHPVYQYFARRYGLNIKSVMWEPDVLPDEQMWTELQEIVKEHPAKWMIWEGEPKPESVAKLKAMGIDSIVYDPCGNRPETGDFLTVMKQNVKNLKEIFEAKN